MTVSFNGLTPPVTHAKTSPPRFGSVLSFDSGPEGGAYMRILEDHFVNVVSSGKVLEVNVDDPDEAFVNDPDSALRFYDLVTKDGVPRYATDQDKRDLYDADQTIESTSDFAAFTHELALRQKKDAILLPKRETAMQRIDRWLSEVGLSRETPGIKIKHNLVQTGPNAFTTVPYLTYNGTRVEVRTIDDNQVLTDTSGNPVTIEDPPEPTPEVTDKTEVPAEEEPRTRSRFFLFRWFGW